jgi:hypothetical protein
VKGVSVEGQSRNVFLCLCRRSAKFFAARILGSFMSNLGIAAIQNVGAKLFPVALDLRLQNGHFLIVLSPLYEQENRHFVAVSPKATNVEKPHHAKKFLMRLHSELPLLRIS